MTVTQTAAPRKLNSTKRRHCMRSTPASGPAITRIPKTKRAKNTVAGPNLSNSFSPRSIFWSDTRNTR